MNKFALTTIAALPGQGGGAMSALRAEVQKEPMPIFDHEGKMIFAAIDRQIQASKSLPRPPAPKPARNPFTREGEAEKLDAKASTTPAKWVFFDVNGTPVQGNDPYYDVKLALKQGKSIEVAFGPGGAWMDWDSKDSPGWTSSPECYRVKE